MSIEKSQRLKDVKVPARFYQRHRTGLAALDEVFGGENPGVLPGGSYLMTGMPGAGKTTLVLQMIDAYSRSGLRTLFNIGEQSLQMVKMAADRIRLTGDFEVTSFKDVNELMEHATDGKYDIVAQDSLQSLKDAEFPQLHEARLWLQAGKKLLTLSSDFGMTTFIVNHVTKGGDLRGSNEFAHDADAHLHLSISKDTGNRVFELKKNRFGPAAMPYEITMTGDGLDLRKAAFGPDSPPPQDESTSLLAVTKKLLQEGRKLSGYSHESEPEIISLKASGNAMRAALRIASKQLESTGTKIIRETINRKEHVYVDPNA